MKSVRIIDAEAPQPTAWDALENAVFKACNVAYMLSCAVEERVGQDKKQAMEQSEAVCFGVYELQDCVRETKRLYHELRERPLGR